MNNGPIEPSASNRQMAHSLREIYIALTAEGFNEAQALAMCGTVISTAMTLGAQENEDD